MQLQINEQADLDSYIRSIRDWLMSGDGFLRLVRSGSAGLACQARSLVLAPREKGENETR
jgi:hypothetical protein